MARNGDRMKARAKAERIMLDFDRLTGLDGYVTYCELEAAGNDLEDSPSLDLKEAISEMAGICRKISLPTSDPLGIGGLMFDGSRIAQLMMKGSAIDGGLLERVLGSALVGLKAYASMRDLDRPAGHRLAFRELGLSMEGSPGDQHGNPGLQSGPRPVSLI